MLPFSANIETFAPQIDFYKRIEEAKKSGFEYIEFWSWENKNLELIGEYCRHFGLKISSFSGDAAEFALCDKTHQKGYIRYALNSIEAAKKVDCKTIVIHSNALGDEGRVVNSYEDIPRATLYENMIETLAMIAPYAEKANVTFVLEPLNTYVDHPGYTLTTIKDAVEIVKAVNSPNIKILYDMYHMQIMQGNLIETFRNYKKYIGLIHIADNPGRFEPGTGEINYGFIIKELEKLNYEGVVAFELTPKNSYEEAAKAVLALRN